MGALAIVAFVIIAMALSANNTVAKFVQLMIAAVILGVLLRDTSGVREAITNMQNLALSTTGKQATS